MNVWWAITAPPYTHLDMVGCNLVWGSSKWKLIFRKKSFPIQNWKNSGQPEILNHHNLESPENRRIERETLTEGVHKFALRNSNI